MIDFFQLNQDVRLVRERKRVRDDVLKALAEGRTDDARRFAIRFRPHSLAARQVLVDRAPQHLPRLEDELQWLLRDALEELILSFELQNENEAPEVAQERATKELLWTFAALWSEPLTGRQSDVETLLQDASLTEVVRPFLDALHRASERSGRSTDESGGRGRN